MSQLRCRPGDLAVVVRATVTREMLGRLVVVVRRFQNGERISGRRVFERDEPSWVIRSATDGSSLPWQGEFGTLVMVDERVYVDAGLRPIRPNDGEDETLQWTAKPKYIAITRPEALDYQAYARERAREVA